MSEKIYFDNAATTCVRPEVFEVMLPYLTEGYGNPSSIYEIARKSRKAVEEAREKVAKAINANPNEIYFTSGGTEADNWAIKGIIGGKREGHIITSAIEHHAVLETCEYLEKNGVGLTKLPVDGEGIVSPGELEKAFRPDTKLVSVMLANNEIGTIQAVKELGAAAHAHGAVFHTDAVAAVGHVPIDVKEMNIDMLSLSAHKLFGPKGTGVLYVKSGVKLEPILHGGSQERNRRAGTENVAGIVGLGRAIELLYGEMIEDNKRLTELRNRIIDGILGGIPHTRLNGSREKRLPGNVNISFDFIEGESLLLLLDMKGIYASSGSACTSGSLDPSHVLMALGVKHEQAHGSLRITLGRFNTDEEADILLKELPPIVARLREMSPLS